MSRHRQGRYRGVPVHPAGVRTNPSDPILLHHRNRCTDRTIVACPFNRNVFLVPRSGCHSSPLTPSFFAPREPQPRTSRRRPARPNRPCQQEVDVPSPRSPDSRPPRRQGGIMRTTTTAATSVTAKTAHMPTESWLTSPRRRLADRRGIARRRAREIADRSTARRPANPPIGVR